MGICGGMRGGWLENSRFFAQVDNGVMGRQTATFIDDQYLFENVSRLVSLGPLGQI